MKRHKLIFNDIIKNNHLVFNYLDIGARGDIGLPWSLFDEGTLKVIGFEPDAIEAERLSSKYPNRKYYPHALWGESTERKFYLNRWQSTSSMYPSNESFNRQFEPKHWEGRIVEKELTVKCVTLDSIIKPEDGPDFIKIDTQGSEFEILKGSKTTLTNNVPLVLAETWCAEVYKGAPLTHDIMAFMYDLGYQVFDINVAAAWKHSNLDNVNILTSKSKTIGFDLLFIKRIESIGDITGEQLIKLVALCELYGFRDYSLYLIENSNIFEPELTDKIKNILLENNCKEKKIFTRVTYLLAKLFRSGLSRYPPLH